MAASEPAARRAGPPDGEAGPAREDGPVSEAVIGRPADLLRPLIAYYSGYREAGVAPARHAGLPSPYLTVIVTLDEPLTVAEHPDPRQPAAQFRTLAGGLHTVPALVTHDGWQSGIQLALSPLGARSILGVRAGDLASLDVEGSDVVGAIATELQQRVQEAPSWPDRFAVLDEVLSRKLGAYLRAGVPDVSPQVSFAWQRLLRSGGNIAVAALAKQVGWSDRHLRARFAAEIGLTPKAAARVVRFDRARRLLQERATTGRRLDLAGLAAQCGYYDQAHLDADFRALAGGAPTTWLAREFRNLQAAALAAGEAGNHDEEHTATSGLAYAAGA